MSHTYVGHCSCRHIEVTLYLPIPITECSVRKCRYSYCAKYDGTFVSHPSGHFTIKAQNALRADYQGTETATMLHCRNCNDLIAVSYEDHKDVIGAVRAPLFDTCPSSDNLRQLAF